MCGLDGRRGRKEETKRAGSGDGNLRGEGGHVLIVCFS